VRPPVELERVEDTHGDAQTRSDDIKMNEYVGAEGGKHSTGIWCFAGGFWGYPEKLGRNLRSNLGKDFILWKCQNFIVLYGVDLVKRMEKPTIVVYTIPSMK
jgi:hypothetical protein